jgi:intracellular multiplication protein IcmL
MGDRQRKRPAMSAAPPAGTSAKAPAAGKIGKRPLRKAKKQWLIDDPVPFDNVANARIEIAHHRRLVSLVTGQNTVIAVLALLLILAAPFTQPVYHYDALDPAGNASPMVGLTAPNMTDQAILSWTVNSVTSIMTFGFGDFVARLDRQNRHFTPDGWASFVAAFHRQKIGEIFKQNQLVLTTVPSNVPVIIRQGPNKDGVYQWLVQVPIIMTFTTNNNLTRHQRTVVTLTIVRVRPEDNPDGIAIRRWQVRE